MYIVYVYSIIIKKNNCANKMYFLGFSVLDAMWGQHGIKNFSVLICFLYTKSIKSICKLLHSFFIYILYSIPTFFQTGLCVFILLHIQLTRLATSIDTYLYTLTHTDTQACASRTFHLLKKPKADKFLNQTSDVFHIKPAY